MELKTYGRADRFLAHARPALEAREAENNLMLGIALRLCHNAGWPTAPPYFATVREGDRVVVAALMTPPYNLILHGAPDPAALELIARDLVREGRTPPGTVGPLAVSRAFADVWRTLTGAAVLERMGTRVYVLREACRAPSVGGRLRAATEADLDLVSEWTDRFQHEALPSEQRGPVREPTLARLSAGQVSLWEDGRPVSMAAATRKTTSGVSLNLVYTPPENRNRGYASACVSALSRNLLGSGYAFVALFADRANAVSNSLYLRVGFSPVCDFQEYRFAPAG